MNGKWLLHLVLLLYALFCVMPFWLLISASITGEKEIAFSGYSFLPRQIDLTAYQYLLENHAKILRAYGITVLVTAVGTVVGLAIMVMLSYSIARKDFPWRNGLALYVFITMVFNGGLVPTYLLYTNFFDLKNTIFALIIPNLLVNGFFVMLMRSYFVESIPFEIIESASMDGASEFKTFCYIVIPLSLPVLATVGLFQSIAYWNDWYNGLIYITDSRYYSIQNMLNRMLLDLEFLKSATSVTSGNILTNLPTRSMRMAVGVVGLLPILIMYPFFQKFFVKGLSLGAVKG